MKPGYYMLVNVVFPAVAGGGVDFRWVASNTRRRPNAPRPEPVSAAWPDPDEVDEFMSGGCGVFALALHSLTGWPIWWFPCSAADCGRYGNDQLPYIGHVVLRHPRSGLYVDAYGHRNEEAIRDSFKITTDSPRPITPQWLVTQLRTGNRIGPYTRKTWSNALKLLNDHWGLYGFDWMHRADIRDQPE